MLKFLNNTSPAKLEILAEKKLPKVVKRAAKYSPAYKSLMDDYKLNADNIKTIADFKKFIPVTNKSNYFEKYSYKQLLGRYAGKMKNAMSSSGYTGTFTYGFIPENVIKNSRLGVDATFDYWFDISNRKTFLINCAPMGVHVETSLPLAETSVRSDMAIALLKKVSPNFDQTIIGGDPYFLKKLIEEGDEAKINWEKLQISLITAQDWLPESLRSYLGLRLGINPDNSENRGIYATMGMTELGLNVFHESKYSVGIRRALMRDKNLQAVIGRSDTEAPPCIFHYYPFRTYIESLYYNGNQELIFTVTDPNSIIPIIRYSTGDAGTIVSYSQLQTILSGSYPELLPDLKLPLGMLRGRTKNRLTFQDQYVYVEDIKEGLFSEAEIASKVTGLMKAFTEKNKVLVLVHLKAGVQHSKNLEKKILESIHKYLSIEVEIQLISYYEFHDAIELNYEKKFGS